MLGAWAAMAILVAFVLSGLKVLREYQRGVVFRLGRVVGARGPGIIYVIPGIEKVIRIDLRTITMDPAPERIRCRALCQESLTAGSPRSASRSSRAT